MSSLVSEKVVAIAMLDVENTFGRVHHSSLFDALLVGGVDVVIFDSLYRLYSELQASVVLWDGAERRSYAVFDKEICCRLYYSIWS